MKRLRPLLVFTALAGLVLVSCGSGGGNVVTGGGVTATFTPSNTTPGANSITMSAGTAGGDTFQIDILVTGILDFFGTGFRVLFDSTSTQFQSFDGSTSVLQVNAPNININAAVDPNNAGVVLVSVTSQGQIQGEDLSTMTAELITLTFRATSATGGNAFTFDTPMTRVVTTCPAPPTACSDIPDAMLTWSGGTLTAN